jgi:hypothetical protein
MRLALFLALFSLSARVASALPATAPAALPDVPLGVYVLTFGPGDHPFSKFGHNAVLVLDRNDGSDRVYNFGTFDARSPSLITDFLQGRLMYWVSVSQLGGTFAAYARDNRSISAQRLNLDPAETREFVALLAQSALPENRYYRYDYYLDNCSTKVRDLLDRALAGRLQQARQVPNKLSWREHTSRLTKDSVALNLGLNLLLAGGVDVERSRWEEMFLPSVLAEELGAARLSDGRPLVAETRLWHEARRSPLAERPPERAPWLLALGVAIGGLALGLGHAASRRATRYALAARYALATLALLLGATAGLLGCIFSFFWLCTDHAFAYANENLLLFPPWAFVLSVAAIGAAFERPRFVALLERTVMLLAAGSVLALAIKVLPQCRQDNWMFLAAAIPLWGMLTLAVRRAYKRNPARQPLSLAAKLTSSPIA